MRCSSPSRACCAACARKSRGWWKLNNPPPTTIQRVRRFMDGAVRPGNFRRIGMTEVSDGNHPSLDLLRKFNRGEVRDPPVADTIEAHLEICSECCQMLREMTVDPLVRQLRAAATPTKTDTSQ